MSVSAQVPYKKYTAAPAATVFPTTFRVVLATDLQVSVNSVVVTTGFSLSALGLPAGLDVTFTAPMVGGEVVELQRIIPKSRATDYQQLGNFDAGVVNSDIDRTWMSIQEVDAEVKRSVRIPASSTGVSLDLPAPTALTYLRWNALANALENVLLANVSLISLSPYAQTILDAVSAAAARVVLGATSFGAAVFTAVDAAAARLAILAAKSGANSDITSTSALATMTNVITINGANVAFLPVRQTVLSGPVDTNGLSAFGGVTGAATVSATGTLIATAANGFVAAGHQNRTGSITNPAWTGLSTNGTMYLWLDVNADGTCITGSGTLEPTYRWGGADVVTANQFTFNIQEMAGKVGNGSAAAQTYRVYVGEVTVAGAVVTVITWYALQGRYVSALTGISASAISANHNLGLRPQIHRVAFTPSAATSGYAGDDETGLEAVCDNTTPFITIYGYGAGRLSSTLSAPSNGTARISIANKSTGTVAAITVAAWFVRFYANRGW